MLASETFNGSPGPDWQRRRLGSLAEIVPAVDAVLADMAPHGYSRKELFAARLALEEAICNAIKHGHRHDPSKTAEIRWRVLPDHTLFEVEDEGSGFDLDLVRDATAGENIERPSGRGLLLIRHFAAWVRHNRQGNCITFCICANQTPRETMVLPIGRWQAPESLLPEIASAQDGANP